MAKIQFKENINLKYSFCPILEYVKQIQNVIVIGISNLIIIPVQFSTDTKGYYKCYYMISKI